MAPPQFARPSLEEEKGPCVNFEARRAPLPAPEEVGRAGSPESDIPDEGLDERHKIEPFTQHSGEERMGKPKGTRYVFLESDEEVK